MRRRTGRRMGRRTGEGGVAREEDSQEDGRRMGRRMGGGRMGGGQVRGWEEDEEDGQKDGRRTGGRMEGGQVGGWEEDRWEEDRQEDGRRMVRRMGEGGGVGGCVGGWEEEDGQEMRSFYQLWQVVTSSRFIFCIYSQKEIVEQFTKDLKDSFQHIVVKTLKPSTLPTCVSTDEGLSGGVVVHSCSTMFSLYSSSWGFLGTKFHKHQQLKLQTDMREILYKP